MKFMKRAIIWPFKKLDLVTFKMYDISKRKRIVNTDVGNDVASTRQSVIRRVSYDFYDMTLSTE